MTDSHRARHMDRHQQEPDELLDETIHVGAYEFFLTDDSVEVIGIDPDHPGIEVTVTIIPRTKREAHQLSRALRKCSIRLTALAEELPFEPEPPTPPKDA